MKRSLDEPSFHPRKSRKLQQKTSRSKPSTPARATLQASGNFNNKEDEYLQDYNTIFNADATFTSDAECDLEDVYEECENDTVCFGMISETSLKNFRCPHLSPDLIHGFELYLRGDNFLCLKQNNVEFAVGNLKETTTDALRRLDQEQGLFLQMRCMIRRTLVPSHKTDSGDTGLFFNFFCNIYGPLRMFDYIGNVLEMSDICLQDPQGCDRNVRYRNPHRLDGRDRDARMTIDKFLGAAEVLSESWRGSGDYLDELEMIDHKNLPLADSPAALNKALFPHQQRALHFMQLRERGWNIEGDQPDIWKVKNICNHQMYLNTINDELHIERPPQFRGGILADAMGLGKTLEILALIASDQDQQTSSLQLAQPVTGTVPRCTLVIVPPPLLDVWDAEIKMHCKPANFHFFKHHGKQKLKTADDIFDYHVILTTYDTIKNEFRNSNTHASVLYMVQWHRIVLDEGHWIRTQGTKREEAIFNLKANRRWAVTGTPIQNHISDFQSLLSFLRVHPYDDLKHFERDTVRYVKDDPKAVKARLQRLVAYITIRRTNQTIDLPDRDDQVRKLKFSASERDLYDQVDLRVMHARGLSRDGSRPTDSKHHVFRGLAQLSAVCNFGVLADTNRGTRPDLRADWDSEIAQDTFNGLIAAGQGYCSRCREDVIATRDEMQISSHAKSSSACPILVSRCGKIMCSRCNKRQRRESSTFYCNCGSSCIALEVSTSKLDPQLHQGCAITPENRPTKIKYLVEDLKANQNVKSVVFSQWRATLNLAAGALTEANIHFARYDGQVSANERKEELLRFKDDPDVKVILFTIQCGKEGLNLTAATRAYLMEPLWNPTVEEQALARIYRVGQTKPVTTIRFVMANSFEEEIVAKQQKKKDFTDLLLTNRPPTSQFETGIQFNQIKFLLS